MAKLNWLDTVARLGTSQIGKRRHQQTGGRHGIGWKENISWSLLNWTCIRTILISPVMNSSHKSETLEQNLKLKEYSEMMMELKKKANLSPLRNINEHEKQKLLTNSDKRIKLFLGGNRTGKSIWGAHETSRYLHKSHPFIQFDKRPVGIWVVTESYDVQRDIIQPMLRQFIDERRIVDSATIKRNCWSWLKYRANDGTISEISFKSFDQGREKFQGAGKQFIWFDEEPPRDIWEECSVREEAGRECRIALTMTPIKGMSWVYSELFLNTANEDIHTVTVTWEDNPWLDEEQKERMARGLTAEALQVRREGKFVRMVGLVCPWFERSVHVQPITFKPDWTPYRVIDFGFTEPTCVIWPGVDYDGTVYVYDGIYQSGLTTPQLKDAIIRKDAKRYITACYADSAQASDIRQLQDEGLSVIPVNKTSGDSRESWDEYRARILMEWGRIPANGKPRIVLGANLVRYDERLGREVNWAVHELETLRWDERVVEGITESRPRWGNQPKHFVDCLSYFLAEHMKEHSFETPAPVREVGERYQEIGWQKGHDAFEL